MLRVLKECNFQSELTLCEVGSEQWEKNGGATYIPDDTTKIIETPFARLKNILVNRIVPLDSSNVLFGTVDGFIHYDPSKKINFEKPYPVHIRSVEALKNTEDSKIIFKGADLIQLGKTKSKLKKQFNKRPKLYDFINQNKINPKNERSLVQFVDYINNQKIQL